MDFTDRAMLAGLVAVAIPVAVHFVGRRPPRVVLLPTARFAEGAQADSRARSLLRRILLLASRVAVVALLVLALAGPRTAGEPIKNLQTGATAAPSSSRAASPDSTAANSAAVAPLLAKGVVACAPIKVLVVDAAEEKDLKVRSADLVAAALQGDTLRPKQVGCHKVISDRLTGGYNVPSASACQVDVVFWVGSHSGMTLPNVILRKQRGFVWVPADPVPPDESLARLVEPGPDGVQSMPNGATIDPGGYTSDLLAAFEAGTSGDLGAPVFRQRLDLKGHPVVCFHDGRPAITESSFAIRPSDPVTRVVTLAVGPAPAWGDLASRAEFVVLINSLAEALGPKVHATGATAAPSAAVPPGKSARLLDSATVAPLLSEGTIPRGADLTLWCVLGLALMLVAEGLLASPRRT